MIDMDAPIKYSLQYIEKKSPTQDSHKLRKRIASYYKNNIHHEKYGIRDKRNFDSSIAKLIEQEVGISVPNTIGYGIIYYTDELMMSCSLPDFLDIISTVSLALNCTSSSGKLSNWTKFVERTFREENVTYTIDEFGAIHPYIDNEFANNHETTLCALNNEKYEHVKKIYMHAFDSLRSDKQNTRIAIKDIFESVESLSRLIDPKIKTLSANEVNNNLKTICKNLFSDTDEKNFIGEMIASLAKWVNAHHTYRHGQKKETHTEPSIESAVLSVSTGASYLRFLLEIDQKMTELPIPKKIITEENT